MKSKKDRTSGLSQLHFYSKGFEPGSDSRLCSVIVRVRVVLKRTVVGDSD